MAPLRLFGQRPRRGRSPVEHRGTFVRPSVRSFIHLWAGLRPERADFRPERADSRPERADFRPERADLGLERADSRPERAYFRPERVDFRPERAWGGRTNERTDGRTDKRTKVPCVLQDFVPFGAAAQKGGGGGGRGKEEGWEKETRLRRIRTQLKKIKRRKKE